MLLTCYLWRADLVLYKYRARNSNPSQELLYLNSEIKGLLVARVEAPHGTSTVPEGEN